MTRAAQPAPLRRRWDRFLLRTEGRLDGEAADRVLPWVLAGALFLVLAALSTAAIRSLDGGSGLGPWIQAAWDRSHAGPSHPVGGVDPASGSGALGSEPLLLLDRWLPAAVVLALFQSFAIAIGVVPLWRLARREAHLRVGATAVVIAAYALAPTLQRTNLSTFHPEVVALPALMAAYLRARQEQWVVYAVLVAIALLARGDVGITVAALGALVALAGHRRAGAITAVVGVAWTAMAVLVWAPELPTGRLTPAEEFVARSTGPLAVVPRLLADPLTLGRELFSEPSVLFLVVVLSPLLFLPLVSPRRLAAAAPCLALAMIADTLVQEAAERGVINLSPAASHIAPAMAFVFIGLVFALERIGDLSVTRVNVDRRVLIALLAGATLLFLTESPTSPYREPWAWGSQDAVDGARLEAADLIDDDEAVAVSPSLTAQVAERGMLLELPPAPADLDRERLTGLAGEVDVVLLDTTGEDPLTARPFWADRDVRRVLATLERAGFAPVYGAQGIHLLRAGGQADASG